MIEKCSKCGTPTLEFEFSDEQRIQVSACLEQEIDSWAFYIIKNEYGYSHRDSKLILLHYNSPYGRCIKCEKEGLEGECVECPHCKAFNYNYNAETPFDKDFCARLEYNLSFSELENEKVKDYWCDGVDHLPQDIKSLARSNILRDKVISTKAWIGTDGQGIYDMHVFFGEQSLEYCRKGERLESCIPTGNYKDWIQIDPAGKWIEIELL